jgi:hypothetical protein
MRIVRVIGRTTIVEHIRVIPIIPIITNISIIASITIITNVVFSVNQAHNIQDKSCMLCKYLTYKIQAVNNVR